MENSFKCIIVVVVIVLFMAVKTIIDTFLSFLEELKENSNLAKHAIH